mmetsp:Transcript_10679/g.18989  ORF Transcript_10679/g.18989 Transcript_10679/m.18989 type:complete len:140 (-) Transcript_10679:1474-1893(-)
MRFAAPEDLVRCCAAPLDTNLTGMDTYPGLCGVLKNDCVDCAAEEIEVAVHKEDVAERFTDTVTTSTPTPMAAKVIAHLECVGPCSSPNGKRSDSWTARYILLFRTKKNRHTQVQAQRKINSGSKGPNAQAMQYLCTLQ